MEKKNNKKQQMRTEDEEIESTPVEQSVFHKTKIVINAIKYLKKVIQKLSQDEMDATNKQKLFFKFPCCSHDLTSFLPDIDEFMALLLHSNRTLCPCIRRMAIC
jgi:hypothetical protein